MTDEHGAELLDHGAARALMVSAIDGALDVERERELAVHLVSCPECKALYSRLQQAEVALRGLAFSHPPADTVDTAVSRALTVLRGDADPGPGTWAGPQPPQSAGVDIAPARMVEPAPLPGPIFAEPEGSHETGQLPRDDEDDGPDFLRAILSEPDSTPVAAAVIPAPDDTQDEAHEPPEREPEGVVPPVAPFDDIDSPGARPPTPDDLAEELTDDDLHLPPLPPRPGEPHHEPVVVPPALERDVEPWAAEPADARTAAPAEPVTRRPAPSPARRRSGAGRWLVAITAAVLLALIAGLLITRSQTGGGKVPTAQEVRDRVRATFTQLRTLKASFTIRRLDLYPVSRQGATMQYSFSDGTTTGRLVFDRAEGSREESSTDVGNTEVGTTRVAQTVGELRTLQGTGTAAKVAIVRNPPLGPPDGAFHPLLGSLDRAVGEIAQMIEDASGLQVLGLRKTPDGQVVDVRFDVVPSDLTRADRVEVSLDARTYFPLHIRREISRANGRVLAPESILGGAALQTAFGNRDRILTEDTVLTDVVLGDVILPGDFALDVPQGAATQSSDGSYQRVSQSDLATKLHFAPLFPQSLGSDWSQQALAVYSGTPSKWGPGGSYPAPDAIFEATYFNGARTIVISERHMPNGPFDLSGSPLGPGTLPIQVTPQTRADKTFFYASSPELPPHAYGFLGNVFVLVTGNASPDELTGIVASMAEAPATPGPSGSPVSATSTP
jgi:hypothetical protein